MLRPAVIDCLTAVLGEHATALGDMGRFLSNPRDPAMGDLAFGCFGLAKILRKSPPEIAQDLATKIPSGGLIASAEAAGPYLNFRADPSALLDATCRAVADGTLMAEAHAETPQRVMIEFSQPNTHKTFHVGHLRNVALGDSLVRLHRACGHTVTSANYYGDYGIDVAKCLWWLQTHPDLEAPEEGRTAWLGQAYVLANDAITADRTLLDEARGVLQAMEAQQPDVVALYQQTRQWCLDEFADTYRWLDVQFDIDFFESAVEEEGAAIVDAQLAAGVFEISDGAVVCNLEPDLDVPALVRKGDGTSLYLTWDLALARRKFEDHDIERSLYVVGSEQRFHFKQLFLTLSRMGYARAIDCRHVAYELVMLPMGKKMSSREGTAIPLHLLREAVSDAIDARITEAENEGRSRIPAGDRDQTIHRIAVASLRYGMLRVGTNKQVTFAIDDWTSPEGDTGAYLLYSIARIRSIFRKAGEDVDLADGVPPTPAFGQVAEERALLNHLAKLPATVARATEATDPSSVAAWIYDGARAFNRFWDHCPVNDAEPDLRRARLALIRATDRMMTTGLDLLGITAVDAM